MRLGIKFNCLIIILLIFSNYQSNAEDRITSTPLLNLDKIKPSYESLDQKEENSVNKKSIKKKN